MPEDTAVLDALAAITAVSIAGSELPAGSMSPAWPRWSR